MQEISALLVLLIPNTIADHVNIQWNLRERDTLGPKWFVPFIEVVLF